MRVAIYSRVSLLMQSNNLQLSELDEYAKKRNFKVHGTYIDTITGDNEKRKGVRTRYDDLIADAKAKKFDAVLVWKFDRLSRTLDELSGALKLFQKLGIDFISATQPIDTTGPLGKAMYGILAVFAEFEREMIVERMQAGRKYVQEHGVNTKGEPSKLGKPEKYTLEQKQRMIAARSRGKTLASISKAENIPIPSLYTILRREFISRRMAQ